MRDLETVRLEETAQHLQGVAYDEPQPLDLSQHCPVFGFVCAVPLPDGCLPPPGKLRFRLGAGASIDRHEAQKSCRFEGLERFSIQYRPGDPDMCFPLGILATSSLPKPSRTLLLGHPDRLPEQPAADSRGCSIGVDVFDAAGRAILELVEHEVVDSWLNGTLAANAEIAALESVEGVRNILHWLDRFGRQMGVFNITHPCGANAVIAICCDENGARPVIGSAAGMDLRSTVTHACCEAIVGWRNLMAIDMNAITEDSLPPLHRRGLRLFRGQETLPSVKANATVCLSSANTQAGAHPETRARLADLVERLDREVALFDLTRTDIAVPTVRAVFDGSGCPWQPRIPNVHDSW